MSSIVETVNSPVLTRALPYLQYGSSLLLSSLLVVSKAIFSSLTFLARIVAHPLIFLSPFPILLYILAPVIVFVQLLFDLVVTTPYRVISYLSDAFYPVYVFVGVACITGALVGLGGRLFIIGTVYLSAPAPRLSDDAYDEKPLRRP